MLDRYRQNMAAQGTDRSSAYILSPAAVPQTPDSPKKSVFAGFGLAFAAILAAICGTVREVTQRGFRTRLDLERATRMHVMGSVLDVSTVRDAREYGSTPMEIATYLMRDKGTPFAEAFRSISAGLRVGQQSQRHKLISITSAVQGEGKSVISLCLARSVARAGNRVLLIDCDLRRQILTDAFERTGAPGLVDLLRGKADLAAVTVLDEPSGASVIVTGETTQDDYDLMLRGTFKKMIDSFADKFDLIILDTPPVISVTESRILAAICDATIVVVKWQSTTQQLLSRTLSELSEAGANVIGTVLSQVDARKIAALGAEAHYYRRYGR